MLRAGLLPAISALVLLGCTHTPARTRPEPPTADDHSATTRAVPWYSALQPWPIPDRIEGERIDEFEADGLAQIEHLSRYSYDPNMPREVTFRALLSTRTFEGERVGGGNHLSLQALAFRSLPKQPDAKQAFEELLRRAHPAGKLYALCGLYLIDRTAFDSHAAQFRGSPARVRTFFECLLGSSSMGDLIESRNHGIARGDYVDRLAGSN